MYANHGATKEEHLSWLERVDIDIIKIHFIFGLDNNPCGVLGFMDIN